MSVSAINPISFKGNTKQAQANQSVQHEKRTGGFAPAVGSFFIPGLGHLMNGNNKAGLKFLGGTVGLTVLGIFSSLSAGIALMKNSKALTILSTAGFYGSIFGNFALKIADIVKAYKGEYPEEIKETEQFETKVNAQA